MMTFADKLAWAATQPWYLHMQQCPQEPEWHAEGDVMTHTLMVCEEMERLLEEERLPEGDTQALQWAALLHDVGKPPTTTRVDGRLTSPNHGNVGQHLARRILLEQAVPLTIRECACDLIRHHTRPFHVHKQHAVERYVIETSWLANNRLLYLLAKADNAGRICDNAAESDGWIDCWRDECVAAGCYSAPYTFASDHARVLFFKGRLDNLFYVPFEEARPRVIMLSGLPGAGKTTWVVRHGQDRPVVELDEIRKQRAISPTEQQGEVIQEAQRQCKALLAAKREFIFSATNVTGLLRGRWIELFLDYDYTIDLRYFEPPLEVLFRQNKDRDGYVPEPVIWKMIDSMDFPHLTECHRLAIEA